MEQVRRRWLFSLVTFALAAALSVGMTLSEAFLTGGIGQGLGLAFLGSLPLFALGSLLGAMASSGDSAVPHPASVGVSAVIGLAVGFLVTGGFLLPNMAPYTLYLVCLTALSGGALLQGWILDARPTERLLDQAWTERGEVTVKERVRYREGRGRRILMEDERVRGAEDLDGAPGREWESVVVDAMRGERMEPGPVLYIGGGSGTLTRILLEHFPGVRIVVVEGSEEIVRMARKYLWPFPEWGGIQLHVGDPWALTADMVEGFSLVVVDGGLLPALGRLPAVASGGWAELGRLAGARGTVVLGEIGRGGRPGQASLEAFMNQASEAFARVVYYQGSEGGLFLMSGPEAPPWPPCLGGFQVTASKEG
ncbi:MAG: spermidine synthase [Longimicrobiales bacterium]